MLTREQCRRADQIAIEKFRIPSLVLMENAGRSCAEKLIVHSGTQSCEKQAVVILCGPGNNGGDGFVIARHLYNAGLKTKIVLFCAREKFTGDALSNLLALSEFEMTVDEFDQNWTEEDFCSIFASVNGEKTTWIVDAMLGTGAKGEPRSPMNLAISVANEMDVTRMAVDIPSGLDCDTGIPSETTFCSDVTCTFIDQKIGFANPVASPFLGEVVVTGIGAPPEILSFCGNSNG